MIWLGFALGAAASAAALLALWLWWERMRERVEMADGRVYFSDDNWTTVYLQTPAGKVRKVTGREADRARFLAIVSH